MVVEVRWASVARAWHRVGGDNTWVRFDTKAGSLGDFAAAVQAANEAHDQRDEEFHVLGEAPTFAPRGYAVMLGLAGDLDTVHHWVDDLAEFLTERGFEGTLAGATDVGPPAWARPLNGWHPTAFLSWNLDINAMIADPQRSGGWYVDPATTRRAAELADRWARLPDAEIVLRQETYSVAVSLVDASEPLARGALALGMAGLQFRRKKDLLVNHVSFNSAGDTIFQTLGGSQTWQQRIDRLTSALTASPADVTQGYIRPGNIWELSISQLHRPVPLPGLRANNVRYNRHLLDRYLPDAHGVQVVTKHHLERAHDLSHWQLTDLGHARYLVQAPDLAPWYADALPNPDVLDQARRDWAGALFTENVINDNPAPWPGAVPTTEAQIRALDPKLRGQM